MEPKSKFLQYVPIISIIFTGILSGAVLIVSTTWSISSLHTVNMVQDERIGHLEQAQEKTNDNINQLRMEMKNGFEKLYQFYIESEKK